MLPGAGDIHQVHPVSIESSISLIIIITAYFHWWNITFSFIGEAVLLFGVVQTHPCGLTKRAQEGALPSSWATALPSLDGRRG